MKRKKRILWRGFGVFSQFNGLYGVASTPKCANELLWVVSRDFNYKIIKPRIEKVVVFTYVWKRGKTSKVTKTTSNKMISYIRSWRRPAPQNNYTKHFVKKLRD